MPDVPVTLTPWFDAKDWPEGREGQMFPTDLGHHFYNRNAGGWCEEGWSDVPILEVPPDVLLDPQPTRWCDPSPPDMSDPLGPLTVAALRRIFNAACYKNQQASVDDLDRLRRALDALGTDETHERKDDT